MQTEFEFVLPKGFVDEEGNVHRAGRMRLAMAMDEISPLRDPRVRANEAYLALILLSQVITRLGSFTKVTPTMLERCFAADIIFLQDFYTRINEIDLNHTTVGCPNCGHVFEIEIP